MAEKWIESLAVTHEMGGYCGSQFVLDSRVLSFAEAVLNERPKEWRCFLCDEVFTDEKAAHEHFGGDEYELHETAGCIDPLRTDEKARLQELRDAQEHARKCQHEAEENCEASGVLESYRSELVRLFGGSTPHQAWLKLEAAQNEAAMWKQKYEEAHPEEAA